MRYVIEKFKEIETQLEDWKMSSARQGADFALKVVFSWYENIDLRQLRTLRDGSKWIEDPACVEL